jgi:hypothetical protein
VRLGPSKAGDQRAGRKDEGQWVMLARKAGRGVVRDDQLLRMFFCCSRFMEAMRCFE